ncbi:hypothetical protein FNF28_07850 [Cafeteria roenbergensis]|uniref:UDP-N-acetylglucosamine diphosphorylase n=1 Tax=Cafeteria roenbergensis TaxID=33653 RepID=A0A5A8BY29_CAFRO|nr:hypothetical protein FNF28_07850 [Cafeteria roenbergensis]
MAASACPGSAAIPEAVRAKFVENGQGHVFEFVDKGLVPAGVPSVEAFVEQLSALADDLPRINKLFASTMAAAAATVDRSSSELTPVDESDVLSAASASAAERDSWRARGLAAIAAGQVAVVVLAGGQGTRLGSSLPKAAYDAGLPSGKVLIRLQAERIQRLRTLAAAVAGADPSSVHLPWFVMTSPQTHEATVACFAEHGNFGLPEEDVTLFQQGQLPSFTPEGKIMLESATSLALGPDGNGGIYRALHVNGCVADMEARGVKIVHAYAVDNLVGMLCRKGGRFSVVEYSDMPAALKQERVGDGEAAPLRFRAGNICVHAYDIEFLRGPAHPDRLSEVFHVARKKIPCADPATGLTMSKAAIETENAVKLEGFIFDVFEEAERTVLLEVDRSDEFSPVKNAPAKGLSDSPDTARQMASDEARRWLEAAGATVEGEGLVELSPLVSYGGEGLEALAGATVSAPCCICLQAELEALPSSLAMPSAPSSVTLPSGREAVCADGCSRAVDASLGISGNALSFSVLAL